MTTAFREADVLRAPAGSATGGRFQPKRNSAPSMSLLSRGDIGGVDEDIARDEAAALIPAHEGWRQARVAQAAAHVLFVRRGEVGWEPRTLQLEQFTSRTRRELGKQHRVGPHRRQLTLHDVIRHPRAELVPAATGRWFARVPHAPGGGDWAVPLSCQAVSELARFVPTYDQVAQRAAAVAMSRPSDERLAIQAQVERLREPLPAPRRW